MVPESKFYRFLYLAHPAGTPFNMVLIFLFTYISNDVREGHLRLLPWLDAPYKSMKTPQDV
jgi:hypothetical protein